MARDRAAEFQAIIREYFEEDRSTPARPRTLAKRLKISAAQMAPFLAAIEQLIAEGELHRRSDGMLVRPATQGTLVGTVRRSPSGSGLFFPAMTSTSPDADEPDALSQDDGGTDAAIAFEDGAVEADGEPSADEIVSDEIINESEAVRESAEDSSDDEEDGPRDSDGSGADQGLLSDGTVVALGDDELVSDEAVASGHRVPIEVDDEWLIKPSHGTIEPISIAAEDLLGALTGDTVRVRLLRRWRTGGQRCGRVVEIVRRAKSTFVGVYHERRGQGHVTVDGGVIAGPVSVGDPGAKGAAPNDKVVIELLQFPTLSRSAEGVIVKVLGPRGEPGVDCLSVIHEFGLPDEFPEAVLEDAREAARRFDETDLTGRVDLTHETIITIDPVDARDFDDAISLSQDEKGHWRLGVHIADVAHFVRLHSPLDREARRRGNSVYLPDRVLPMLPEVLSNALASLQQGQVRFTKTAWIDFTPDGIPTKTELANTAIRVTKRFAYEQVMPILQDPAQAPADVSPAVLKLLQAMHTLAMRLRKRRFAHGALDLQLPEVKLDFDPDRHVSGAHTVAHDESHQIIEEFMLAANVAVSNFLAQRDWSQLYRVHGVPDERKLRALGEFVRGLGVDARPWLGKREIQALLKQVRGQPAEYAISYALLRSLKQAEYSPEPIGHFALDELHYCHFTSPIRRYPDLVIHRLVDEALLRPDQPRLPTEAELARLGEHCSMTERRAESAERELIKIKLLNFLADKVGWQQWATITGVERFGLFCLGLELPAEGLVHVRQLPPDSYDYDNRLHTLTARQSGTVYRLGDRVRVEVAAIDREKRLLEYRLVTDGKRSTAGRRVVRDIGGDAETGASAGAELSHRNRSSGGASARRGGKKPSPFPGSKGRGGKRR